MNDPRSEPITSTERRSPRRRCPAHPALAAGLLVMFAAGCSSNDAVETTGELAPTTDVAPATEAATDLTTSTSEARADADLPPEPEPEPEPNSDEAPTEAASDVSNPAITPAAPNVDAQPGASTLILAAGPLQLLAWNDGLLSIGLVDQPEELPDNASDAGADADDLPSGLDRRPTIAAEYTADGVDWTPVELDPPVDGFAQFRVDGEQLVVWAVAGPETGASEPSLQVAVTSDLTEWTSTEFALPDQPLEDAPDWVNQETWVSSVALDDEEWVALVTADLWVGFEALFPDEVRDVLSRAGYSLIDDADGLEIRYVDPDTSEEVVLDYSWDDLGVDASARDYLEGQSTTEVLRGDFTGVVDRSAGPAAIGGARLVPFEGSLIALGAEPLISDDGTEWRPLDGLPADVFIQSGTVLESGELLVVASDGDVTQAWILQPDASEFVAGDLPELNGSFDVYAAASNGAFVVDTAESVIPEFEPSTIVVDHGGYSTAITSGETGETVVATDLATGEVVYESSFSWTDPDRIDHYEWDDAAKTGAFVLRDAGGAEIVRIPDEVIEAAWAAQLPDQSADDPVDETTVYEPDLWVIATLDGSAWTAVDADDARPGDAVAILDDHVVYATTDGWNRLPLG